MMLINNKKVNSIVTECYKSIRTNILFSSIDRDKKKLLITSSEPGEGKSLTASNLAISFSEKDEKILIIDCDLRKPTIHKKFQISNLNGLTDVLVDRTLLQEAISKYSDNINILTAGSRVPNPSEILSSLSIESLFSELEKEYDRIIIDSPPILAVTDAQILSSKVDSNILVVRVNKTKKKLVKESVGLLKKAKANILGIIMNGQELDSKEYYRYYE